MDSESKDNVLDLDYSVNNSDKNDLVRALILNEVLNSRSRFISSTETELVI